MATAILTPAVLTHLHPFVFRFRSLSMRFPMLALFAFLSASVGLAQQPAEPADEDVLRFRVDVDPVCQGRIEGLKRSGAATLVTGPAEFGPAGTVQPTEGLYLGIIRQNTSPDEPPMMRLVRVKVVEVLEGGSLAVELGPAAAK